MVPFICQLNTLAGVLVPKIMYQIYNNVPDVIIGSLIIMDPLLPIVWTQTNRGSNVTMCIDTSYIQVYSLLFVSCAF